LENVGFCDPRWDNLNSRLWDGLATLARRARADAAPPHLPPMELFIAAGNPAPDQQLVFGVCAGLERALPERGQCGGWWRRRESRGEKEAEREARGSTSRVDHVGSPPLLAVGEVLGDETLLIPHPAHLGGVGRFDLDEVGQHLPLFPKRMRRKVIVWRGTPEADAEWTAEEAASDGDDRSTKDWSRYPRVAACLHGALRPDRVDAKFFPWGDTMLGKLFGGEHISKRHLDYRYFLHTPGVNMSYSFGLGWKLLGGTPVLYTGLTGRQRVWLDPLEVEEEGTGEVEGVVSLHQRVEDKESEKISSPLRGWVHYVPVHPDLHDLQEKLDWADAHASEVQAMERRARRFALREMSWEYSLAYTFHLVRRLWELQQKRSGRERTTKSGSLSS